jgi:triacylglycerol lipase
VRSRSQLWVGLSLALVACGGVRSTTDAAVDTPDSGALTVDAGEERDAGTPDAGVADAGAPDAGVTTDAGSDAGTDAGFTIDGIVFVHGINGSKDDWAPMINRFLADGWPANRLIANTYMDPRFGCNDANATQLRTWVNQLRMAGAQHVAVVAHSMGGLSSRYYLKDLMGTANVEVFATLGTMHHGLSTPCLNPLPVCVWQQLCESGMFIADLNAPPATPGPTRWTSIFSDGDDTVPMMSSQLTGANNILVPGLEHDGPNGLQSSAVVYQHVLDALR